MFPCAVWVYSTQKCEAVNFPKFELACVHARPLGYLGMPYLYIEPVHHAHMHAAHMPDVMSQGS